MDMEGIWEMKVRHIIFGTPQKHKIDYNKSYSPTIEPATLRVYICLGCESSHIYSVINVKTAFQKIIGKPEDRIYTTAPQCYLQWTEKHLNFQYDKFKKCLFIILVLQKFGFVCCQVYDAYPSKHFGNNKFIYVSLATDDVFVSCPSYWIFMT